MNIARLVLPLLVCALLVACAGRDTAPEEGAQARAERERRDRTAREGSRDSARGSDRDRRVGEMEALEPGEDDDPLLDELVVYFDFDRDEVKSEYRDMLRAHADFLNENPRARLRLEGHTDERGSREYNVALGERRALSVRRFLLLQGVSSDQLTTVSYGEERPAVDGRNEEARRRNRRVELVYRQ